MRITALALLLATGCSASLSKAIRVTETAAAVTEVGLRRADGAWKLAVTTRIEQCQAKGLGPDATETARAACMGKFGEGEKAESALKAVAKAYDLVAEAISLLKGAQPQLQQLGIR